MKLKRFFAAALAGTFLALSLTACGGNTNADTNTDASNDTAASTGETTTVKLGVVGSIYEDLWAPAKEALKEEGIDLEIVQFSDYVTPNNALANGEIDLNAFQHKAYLNNDAAVNGYDLTVIGDTLIAPLCIYSEKYDSVDAIKEAAGAK